MGAVIGVPRTGSIIYVPGSALVSDIYLVMFLVRSARTRSPSVRLSTSESYFNNCEAGFLSWVLIYISVVLNV